MVFKVQAEDRVYRIGQKNSVNIHYLCAKGTSDDEMWALVKQKLNVLGGAGLTKENFSQANATDNYQDMPTDANAFKELLDAEEDVDTIKIESKVIAKSSDVKSRDEMIDDLLNGIDLSKFETPPSKKIKF